MESSDRTIGVSLMMGGLLLLAGTAFLVSQIRHLSTGADGDAISFWIRVVPALAFVLVGSAMEIAGAIFVVALQHSWMARFVGFAIWLPIAFITTSIALGVLAVAGIAD